MVVAWVTPKVVNQIITHPRGQGRHLQDHLLRLSPPAVRCASISSTIPPPTIPTRTSWRLSAARRLICLDEFETVFGKNLSAFKSNLTKLTFSIRRPYDKYRTELPHRASLCGTTNSLQFITDEENRRYSPWIVESIESPIDHPIDYDHVYAEALALGQEVMKCKKNSPQSWTFWLTRDDID